MSVTGMPSTMSVFFADAVDDQRVYENLQLSFPRDKTVGELSATERAELLTRIDKLNSSTMTRLAPKKRNPMPSPAFESLAAIRARLCPNPSRGRGSRRPLTAEEDAIRRNECGLIITLGPHKYAVRAALEQLAFWLEDPVVHLWTAEQLIVVYATFIYRIQGTVGNFKANFSADFDEATVGMERKTPDPSQAASASTALVDTSSIASAADHVASTAVASGVAVAPVSVSKEVEAAAKAAAQVAAQVAAKVAAQVSGSANGQSNDHGNMSDSAGTETKSLSDMAYDNVFAEHGVGMMDDDDDDDDDDEDGPSMTDFEEDLAVKPE